MPRAMKQIAQKGGSYEQHVSKSYHGWPLQVGGSTSHPVVWGEYFIKTYKDPLLNSPVEWKMRGFFFGGGSTEK